MKTSRSNLIGWPKYHFLSHAEKADLNNKILELVKKYYQEGYSINIAAHKTRKELNCSASVVQSVYYQDEGFRKIVNEQAKNKTRGIFWQDPENHTKS